MYSSYRCIRVIVLFKLSICSSYVFQVHMIKKTRSTISRIPTWLHIQIDMQISKAFSRLSTWLLIQIGIRSTTWSERHFPEYWPGTKFKLIFKSVFALLHGQEEDSTISRISTCLYIQIDIQIDIRAFIRSQ